MAAIRHRSDCGRHPRKSRTTLKQEVLLLSRLVNASPNSHAESLVGGAAVGNSLEHGNKPSEASDIIVGRHFGKGHVRKFADAGQSPLAGRHLLGPGASARELLRCHCVRPGAL